MESDKPQLTPINAVAAGTKKQIIKQVFDFCKGSDQNYCDHLKKNKKNLKLLYKNMSKWRVESITL